MVYTCPLCKSICHHAGNRMVCYDCCYALTGSNVLVWHYRITKAMDLRDCLKKLKQHELSLAFNQDSKGICTVYSEETGEKITSDNPGVLKVAKEKLREITPEIFDMWG